VLAVCKLIAIFKLLLTGDRDAGQNPRQNLRSPLVVTARKIILPSLLIFKKAFFVSVRQSVPV